MTPNKPSIPFQRNAIALALALSCGAVNAANINVSGDCSLVTAINNANTDTDTDGAGGCVAGSGADTLVLPTNSVTTLSTVDNSSNGDNGLPSITSSITIKGNNPTIERSSADGTPVFRIFQVTTTGNLTLNNVTVAGGKLETGRSGAAIRNNGFLTLVNSTITGNSAGDKGGSIKNLKGGSVTITNSTISSNSASKDGAGIYNAGGMTITSSTLYDNSSALSGGAISNAGALKITNTTFSGNKASYGGGIHNHGAITIINSTIHNNSIVGATGIGGGIASDTSMSLKNIIIANSVNGSDCGGTGTTILSGVNLIEDGTCGAPLAGDPGLFARLYNGGDTPTNALKTTSVALNAGDNTLCPPVDQTGVSRPQPTGGTCDIGSFELVTTVPTSVTDIISFFDTAITNTTIKSTGGTGKSTAVRNQLLNAGDLKDRSQTASACDQLTNTLPFIDPDQSVEADDYVTGGTSGTDDAANLVTEINNLKTTWVCP